MPLEIPLELSAVGWPEIIVGTNRMATIRLSVIGQRGKEDCATLEVNTPGSLIVHHLGNRPKAERERLPNPQKLGLKGPDLYQACAAAPGTFRRQIELHVVKWDYFALGPTFFFTVQKVQEDRRRVRIGIEEVHGPERPRCGIFHANDYYRLADIYHAARASLPVGELVYWLVSVEPRFVFRGRMVDVAFPDRPDDHVVVVIKIVEKAELAQSVTRPDVRQLQWIAMLEPEGTIRVNAQELCPSWDDLLKSLHKREGGKR